MQRPEWNGKIVGVRSETNGENVDVFIKLENDKMAGIVVIAAEPARNSDLRSHRRSHHKEILHNMINWQRIFR